MSWVFDSTQYWFDIILVKNDTKYLKLVDSILVSILILRDVTQNVRVYYIASVWF